MNGHQQSGNKPTGAPCHCKKNGPCQKCHNHKCTCPPSPCCDGCKNHCAAKNGHKK